MQKEVERMRGKEPELAAKWLNAVGKERVQSFQDDFASAFEISACVLSLSGNAMTVWSNESLLCHYLSAKEGAHCSMQRTRALQKMCQRGKTILETCYAGVQAFFCPIRMEGEIVAAFFGGVVRTEGGESERYVRFEVPLAEGKKLMQIANLAASIFEMTESITDLKASQEQEERESPLEAQLMLQYRLSRREAVVVSHILEGESNKVIAQELYISEKTVKTHVSNIFRKLQVKDRVQLVLLWTHCCTVLRGDKGIDLKKIVTNLNLIAIVAAALLFALHIPLPAGLVTTISSVGNMIGPLGMLLAGMAIASSPLKKLVLTPRYYLTVFLRLILYPMVTLGLLWLLKAQTWIPDGKAILMTVFLSGITPVCSALNSMVQLYDRDMEESGALYVLTTLLSIVTMPLVIAVFERVM